MTGRPARSHPKLPVQLHVDADALYLLPRLLGAPGQPPASLSQLFEDLVFLMESSYLEEPDEQFVRRAYEIAARRLLHIAASGHEPAAARLHLTIDEDACAFIDFIKSRHPVLFESRSSVATLIAFHAAQYCTDADHLRYLEHRIADIRHIHPDHQKKGRPRLD